MVNPTDLTPDFGIEIQFDSKKESAAKAFRTLSEILEALHSIDIDLIGSIDSEIKPITILEDLRKGSIKGWFKNILEKVPDEGLKDLDWKRAVGHYLVKAKYIIIRSLEGKTEITTREEIKSLERDLYELAKDTNVKQITSYTPIPTAKLVGSIRKVSTALQYAEKDNHIIYIAGQKEKADFNLEFNFSPESIEELLTKEKLSNETEMILKVKKPDYLGESQWDIRHEKIIIYAKISDARWLKKFQERKINVRPGDSLKALVKTTVNYDYNNEVIGTHYEILKVQNVIQADNGNQLDIFPEDETQKTEE